MSKRITVREAAAGCKPREFATLEPVQPAGSLCLWKAGNGAIAFNWRVTINGKTKRYPIGLYDSSAAPKSLEPTKKGFSQLAARKAAENMAAMHCAAIDRGGYEAVQAESKMEAKIQKDAEAAKGYTLSHLFGLYVDHLKVRNAETAKQARNLFNRNVALAFPKVAVTQANQVTTEQVTEVLRPLIARGNQTTARKLKAYLRSAFEQGMEPENNAAVSDELMKFKLKSNPVASLRGIRSARNADKNPLHSNELITYWKLIDVPGREAAALRLHLMLGGQRLEQFVRLKTSDVQPDMIKLMDSKGRNGMLRPIYIPRIGVIDEALVEFELQGEFTLSVKAGKHMSPATLRTWAKKLVGQEIAGFEMKRVRSAVTTLLTKLRVAKEVRDSLQSHDQHGVEAKHYNGYDYYEEKKAALMAMHSYLLTNGEAVQ